jgi:hypothetical protein
MSRIIDNIIAYRVLSMLVTPFPETTAFKFGIIDKTGKKLRDPKTEEEKDSYDYLSRLVFNLKKLLNKLPGGDTKFKNIVAALFLIKEHYELETDIDFIEESKLESLLDLNIILAEETVLVQLFMEEGEGGAITGQGQVTAATGPTNVAGKNVSTDEPVVRKKRPPIVKRQSLKQYAYDLNNKAL